MKRYVWIALMFCCFLLWWINPVEAKAENYFWAEAEVDDGQGGTIKEAGWYQGARPTSVDSIKMDGAPEDLDSDDHLVFDAVPDAECQEWLKSLSGDLECLVSVFATNANIQIGNAQSAEPLTLSHVNAYYGTLTVYGDVYSVLMECGTLKVNGNVDSLNLGFGSGVRATGSVEVTGNVIYVEWYNGEEQIVPGAFYGDVSIAGTVDEGDIYTIVHDDAVDLDTWQTTGEINRCEAGVFKIEQGVLSDEVSYTEVTPELGNYRYNYQCYSHGWNQQAHDATTGAFAFNKSCTAEDVPEGASVQFFGVPAGTTATLDVDLDTVWIEVEGSSNEVENIVLNGDIQELDVDSYGSSYNLTVNGDVKVLQIRKFSFSTLNNLKVKGSVEAATVVDDGFYLGVFYCKDKQIIKDGVWNADILLYTTEAFETSISYKKIEQDALNDALSGYGLGEQTTVSTEDGDIVLQKDAVINILQTDEEYLAVLKQHKDMTTVQSEIKSACQKMGFAVSSLEIPCAMDINLSICYRNTEDQSVFYEYGMEAVTELKDDKSLEFMIQIPDAIYEEEANYFIVRQHIDENGKEELEMLECERNEMFMTFSSQHFSTFMIVKAEGTKAQESVKQNGLVNDNGNWIYMTDGVKDTSKTGLVLYDEEWFYVVNGDLAVNAIGFVEYDGETFYVAEGRVISTANGMVVYNDVWYYVAAGRVVAEHTGLVEYDGEWFYINQGKMDASKSGIVGYDGESFLVAEGRLVREYKGLYHNTLGEKKDNKWYFFSGGQLQAQYTGLVEYDKAWFYLVKGCLAENYTGQVEYDGSTFDVVNGKLVGNEADASDKETNDSGELPVYYAKHDASQPALLFYTDEEPDFEFSYLEIHYVSKEDSSDTKSEVVRAVYGIGPGGICSDSEIWRSGEYNIARVYICNADKERIYKLVEK